MKKKNLKRLNLEFGPYKISVMVCTLQFTAELTSFIHKRLVSELPRK